MIGLKSINGNLIPTEPGSKKSPRISKFKMEILEDEISGHVGPRLVPGRMEFYLVKLKYNNVFWQGLLSDSRLLYNFNISL